MIKLLDDHNTYCTLPNNPIFKWRKELELVVHLGLKKGILNKKEAKYLIPEACMTPIIYALPKMHEDKIDPPLRPIVNGIESITARMGECIDRYLQPAVQNTKAYLKDTKEMLQTLEKRIDTGPLLMATADVSSLYTIIPHRLACEATKWGRRKHTKLPCIQRKFLVKCLDFCLKHSQGP